MSQPNFSGPDYDKDRDQKRLASQQDRIRDLMLDGVWRSVHEITERVGGSENSGQAQLRHLRKPRFDCHIVTKRRKENTFEYHVRRRTEIDAPYVGGTKNNPDSKRMAFLEGLVSDAIQGLRATGDLEGMMHARSIRQKLDEYDGSK